MAVARFTLARTEVGLLSLPTLPVGYFVEVETPCVALPCAPITAAHDCECAHNDIAPCVLETLAGIHATALVGL